MEGRRGHLRILLSELLVELLDFGQQDLQLVFWWQDGHSGREKAKKRKTKMN